MRPIYGELPIHTAISRGNFETTKIIIENTPINSNSVNVLYSRRADSYTPMTILLKKFSEYSSEFIGKVYNGNYSDPLICEKLKGNSKKLLKAKDLFTYMRIHDIVFKKEKEILKVIKNAKEKKVRKKDREKVLGNIEEKYSKILTDLNDSLSGVFFKTLDEVEEFKKGKYLKEIYKK